MAMVTNWIGQIILFILMAILIDLLVPDNSYRKYIKLVIGLILILILLTPIFALIQLDVEQELNTFYEEIFETEEIKSQKKSIENQKVEIEQTQDAYILEEMAVQLEKIVAKSLSDDYQAEIKNIDLKFKDETDKTYEGLQEVIVTVGEKKDSNRVKEVEDIVITMDEDLEGESDEDIALLLKEMWELDDKAITVYWEGGAS